VRWHSRCHVTSAERFSVPVPQLLRMKTRTHAARKASQLVMRLPSLAFQPRIHGVGTTMIRKKITTRKVHEITGLAPSTIRAGKAGTHVLTRVKHGRTYRYILDEVEAFAEGKLKVRGAKQPQLTT